MTRLRSTWADPAKSTSRQAATSRRADPYTMNQEHPQPSPVDYESGSPDSWAESLAPSDAHVKKEYEGDHVKRNEVGFGEFRDDTTKHKDSDQWHGKGKYDNASGATKAAAEKKASNVERIARVLLPTDNDKLIMDQGVDLMALPAPILASTIERMNEISPDALPKEVRYRRALACCKLASRMLPDGTKEEHVEKLSRILSSLGDPTLKSMLATVKVALEEVKKEEQTAGAPPFVKKDEEKKDDKEQTAAAPPPFEKKDDKKDDKEQTAAAPVADKKEEQTAGAPPPPPPPMGEKKDDETASVSCGDMCPGDSEKLNALLQAEAQEAMGGKPVHPELTAMFESPAATPVTGPAVQALPAMASAMPEITFGDDDEPRTASADDDAQLGALFADDPEVQAQREIMAASQEQSSRESGFARMASTGARKLGNVQAPKASAMDEALDTLWDRPNR